jgi:hypothetical protein
VALAGAALAAVPLACADAIAVTFWSGFVLAQVPACVPLEVYVDRERSPRRVGLPLGRRCGR